jgi:alpha-maltose-1-phosphate synthase
MSGSPNSTALAADSLIEKKELETGACEMMVRVLLSRTTANQNARNALMSLVEHEMLAEFWTTFVWNPNSPWHRLLPHGWRTQFVRRSIPEAPAAQVKSAPWRELVRLGVRGTPLQDLLCSNERPFSTTNMGVGFDRRVARRLRTVQPDIVYAYEDGALETFREARKLGIVTVVEQSSEYWRSAQAFFTEDAERSPEFANLHFGLENSRAELERKDEELQLADYVIVASGHVIGTLAGVVPDKKIRIIPYGAPEVKPRAESNGESKGPLKVLFVGSLTQRKGIGYVVQAMEMLGGQAELTIVGSRLRPNPRVDDACRHWRWFESLPHARVLELMRQSDVLVLPSVSDAFGMVVTEAMANGLPVIVTPNTGASELVRDGREGFIVPVGKAESIAEKLEILHRDRATLMKMSRCAETTAAENSWANYRATWARTVRELA